MAFSAEIAFVDLGHIHFIRTLLHLKNSIVAAGALEAFFADMFLMAEDNRAYILGSEGDVATADLFCCYPGRSKKTE